MASAELQAALTNAGRHDDGSSNHHECFNSKDVSTTMPHLRIRHHARPNAALRPLPAGAASAAGAGCRAACRSCAMRVGNRESAGAD